MAGSITSITDISWLRKHLVIHIKSQGEEETRPTHLLTRETNPSVLAERYTERHKSHHLRANSSVHTIYNNTVDVFHSHVERLQLNMISGSSGAGACVSCAPENPILLSETRIIILGFRLDFHLPGFLRRGFTLRPGEGAGDLLPSLSQRNKKRISNPSIVRRTRIRAYETTSSPASAWSGNSS